VIVVAIDSSHLTVSSSASAICLPGLVSGY